MLIISSIVVRNYSYPILAKPMPPPVALVMCAVGKQKARSSDYLRVPEPPPREEEPPPDERMDELPDE